MSDLSRRERNVLRRLALLELREAAHAAAMSLPWEFRGALDATAEPGHPIIGTDGYRMLRDAARSASGRKRGRMIREFEDRCRFLEQEQAARAAKEDVDGRG